MKNKKIAPTPRTDAEEKYTFSWDSLHVDEDGSFIDTEFARQLERELDEANAKIERLRQELSTIKLIQKLKTR